ncbi:transposase [Nocardia sp. NBC_01377]|uniref:transposase n=1 Tax=Nocardia sp. NBC_01377 TaxID=2903595 RepID=UPI00324C5337
MADKPLGLAGAGTLELLAKAPDPAAAARLTISQITAALKRARRRDVPAKAAAIQATLRTEDLGQADIVAIAYAGRAPQPTAAIIDCQSVQGADTVPVRSRGYDAGKRTNGRKRHIAVDSLGLLLVVVVTVASIQDRDGAIRLLAAMRAKFATVLLVWGDGGYAGRLVEWSKYVLALSVQVVKRTENTSGFKVLPRRWVDTEIA